MGRVTDWNSEQLRILRDFYGQRFDVWYVRGVGRYATWHARVIGVDDPRANLNAESPEELMKLMSRASADERQVRQKSGSG